MHHTGAPRGTLQKNRGAVAWPFSRLCRICGPTLFQMALIAALWVAVFGKCGPPPDLPYALPATEMNQTDFESRTVLRYNCRPGYSRATSSQTVYCTPEGKWYITIICVKKSCRNPGDLHNGQVEVKTDFSFGSQIEFSCSEGYILVGSSTSYCEIQGKGVSWSDPLPECIIARCGPPPDISNGKHSGGYEDFYTYGSSVTYRCDPSFTLSGNASITCTVVNKTTGVWSPSPPTCEKITCAQPNISHGTIISGLRTTYKHKDAIMFACKKGSILRGSNLIRCEADGNWNPSPICELSSCTDIPDIPHAFWLHSPKPKKDGTYAVGTVLRYRCQSGYEHATKDSMTVICRKDFSWSPFKGCKEICCPIPDPKGVRVIQHTKTYPENGCTYFSGDTVLYKCHDDKAFSATCKSDGTWDPRTPSCDQTLCPKPEIRNGMLSSNKEQYIESENVTIQCYSGFAMLGSQNITCSENGTWYPEVPKCEQEALKYCEHVFTGKKIMQCLPNSNEVKMALEVYKLSLDIELLKLQIEKAKQTTLEL
ncbi:C4b-binding protein alpha chain isoform X2 [Meriones unguiculatus]|uniref:C4b-binding protein alpha chain isoform X2 n=1 Tax=Meriones unguiculatus TaxID=10047 RepID=UPI000B4EAE03|nr:C4b-binding protein alpha chain isoform X1 [Meriones unguiculatus]XP_060228003.1 C4b-binding protein alpha chain isoform X2 [Meriones unguiculatus]